MNIFDAIIACGAQERLDVMKALEPDIEKGGTRAVLGEIRNFGGRDMIKTAEGWKYHGKGTGAKAQEHKAGAAGSSEKKEEVKIEAPKEEVTGVNNQKISSMADYNLSEENKQIILSELESEPLQCNKTQLKTISNLLSNIFANWRKDYPSTNREFTVQASSFDEEMASPYEGKMRGLIEMTLYKDSRDRRIVIDLPYKTKNGIGFSTDLISENLEGSKGIENFLKKYPKLANQVKKSLINTIGYNLKDATDSSNRNQRYSRDVLKALGLYTTEAAEVLKTLQE